MIRQGKVWGWTKPLFCDNNVEVHEIFAKKNGYCSRHEHRHKANQFYVMSGKLKVIVWKNYGRETLEDVTILGPGESCVVPPGDDHRFVVLEDCHALEIYFVKLDPADIARVDHGGVYQYAETAKVSSGDGDSGGSAEEEGFGPEDRKSYSDPCSHYVLGTRYRPESEIKHSEK